MAWSSADLSADEIALAAADKPLMVAVHALESPQIARWDADGSLAAGADISATGFPATRAYDRLTGLRTKPNAAATTQYLAFQLAASPAAFDCIFIQDHNFGAIGGLTVSVEIANTADFVTGLAEIASWTPGGSNARLADLVLGGATAQRYSGVPYLRVKITGGSHTPEIGEVWAGKRTQLRYFPDVPYDRLALASDTASHVTRSGIETRTVRYRGQRIIEAPFTMSLPADHADITTWFADCAHGTKPFVWCERPASAPADFNIALLQEPRLMMPLSGPFARSFTLTALENGPDFLELGA